MGWRLRIEHITNVRYAGPVLTSFNEARMTPLTLPSQITLESRVTAGPGVPVWTYNDYWGTFVSVFDLPEPHDDLVIRAAATVETEPFGGIPATEERPSWAELAAASADGRLLEFLMPTPLTTVADEISGAAIAEISGLSPDTAAEAISARVREHVTYMPGATGVRTNAQEAWDKGQGVCQDMAQLTVALMHAAGLPGEVRLRLPAPGSEGRAWQHRHRSVPRLGGVLGGLVDTARPDERRRGRRAPRRRRPRPRLHRRPAAQGHLPRPRRGRHDGDGRGHPPRLTRHTRPTAR